MDMERPFRIRSREGISYSGRSLRRISSALTSNTPASASPGSAPWRTSALDVAGARRGGGTASTTGVGGKCRLRPRRRQGANSITPDNINALANAGSKRIRGALDRGGQSGRLGSGRRLSVLPGRLPHASRGSGPI
jgi:hypothetical protein